jgi:hypothetical protein
VAGGAGDGGTSVMFAPFQPSQTLPRSPLERPNFQIRLAFGARVLKLGWCERQHIERSRLTVCPSGARYAVAHNAQKDALGLTTNRNPENMC